jgi:hypothetical protein
MNSLNLRTVFLVNAIVSFLLALGFLLGPEAMLKFFGLSSGTTEQLGAQLIGTALVAVGLLTWFAKDFSDPAAGNAVALSLFFAGLCGLVVTVLGIMSRVVRTNSWLPVVLFLVFIGGYGYLQFFNPRRSEV